MAVLTKKLDNTARFIGLSKLKLKRRKTMFHYRKKMFHISFLLSLFLLNFFENSVVWGSTATKGELLEKIGSQKWIQEKIEIYPELSWLLSEDVEYTQEGTLSQQENSWSRQLKGSHYPEFERTMAAFVNLHLILDGSEIAFERFIEVQPKDEALTKDNFDKLHQYALTIVGPQDEFLKTLEIELLLGDMGKTQHARNLAKEFAIKERDHDLFLSKCLKKCPHIFPSFNTLSLDIQRDLTASTGLAHFGHITQLEGGPEMLKNLVSSDIANTNPKALDMQIFGYMLDVSGARAHEINRGSKSFTNKNFVIINAVRDSLFKLSFCSASEVLSEYLKFQAQLFKFDPSETKGQVLSRLCAMMRLFAYEEGLALKEAYEKLAEHQQNTLNQVWNPFKVHQEKTPTYIPTILINFLDFGVKQGLTKKEALQKCLHESVVSIASFLKNYREDKANQPYSPKKVLNFNKVAGQVKDNLEIFSTHIFFIDQDWNVILGL